MSASASIVTLLLGAATPAGQTAGYLPAERCSIGSSPTSLRWHTSDPAARPPTWVQSALRVGSSLDSHTPRTVWTHLQPCAHCPPWRVLFLADRPRYSRQST